MKINKVVVIGSGTMGSGIAAHLCNANIPVVLLDLKTEIVEKARDRILKSRPPLLFEKSKIKNLKIGNIFDDFKHVTDADWIIEAVVERINIKHDIYLISDSTGETIDRIFLALKAQFSNFKYNNHQYSFTYKDVLILESLKSDGVKILEKYNNLYEYKSNISTEINSLIVNGESGMVLLKLVQIIGKNEIENLDEKSLSYVVEIMNELKVINLRNEVLLKVLPLKI